mmetsp:Transcript_12228/g.28496  ORF Transcript_12228/g.28496 Transcript_12228/m.28496 type:complete len:81 (-) Transcript_12228:978-1220(-)
MAHVAAYGDHIQTRRLPRCPCQEPDAIGECYSPWSPVSKTPLEALTETILHSGAFECYGFVQASTATAAPAAFALMDWQV